MAEGKKHDDHSVATEVAKTVGGALGTVGATAAKVVEKAQAVIATPEPVSEEKAAEEKAKTVKKKAIAAKLAEKSTPKPENTHTKRAAAIKKTKKAKHHRKLGRKTKG
jgi:hypothetical protein